jgi:hypothetical protein
MLPGVAALVLLGLALRDGLPSWARLLLAAYALGVGWMVGFAGGYHLYRVRTMKVVEEVPDAGGSGITEEQRSALERLNDAASEYGPLLNLSMAAFTGVSVIIAIVAVIVAVVTS